MAQPASAESRIDRPEGEPFHWVLLGLFFAVLIWSVIYPHDLFTWFLEVLPALIVLPTLVCTYRRFPLTHLVYILILLHACILMVGGHFTYAREPVFAWLAQVFHWPRNNYDKLGHFAQGFVPAMVAREILLRKTPLKRGGWLFVLVVAVCGALSALYEIFEMAMSMASGGKADDFLGEQGYVWDTQTDMLMAFIGAVVAQLTLSGLHDRQLRESHLTD